MARLLRWLILAAVLVAAFGLSPAHAACVPPRVYLGVPMTGKLHAGESITVGGAYWTNECNDTTVCSTGCGGHCEGPQPERPLKDITIFMAPAGLQLDEIVLAQGVDAASDLTFDRGVVIPPRVSPGWYRFGAYAPGGDVFLGPRIRIVE
jgi:hypothetical protein